LTGRTLGQRAWTGNSLSDGTKAKIRADQEQNRLVIMAARTQVGYSGSGSAACAILPAGALRMPVPVGVEKRHSRASRSPRLDGSDAGPAQRFIDDRANRGKAAATARPSTQAAIDGARRSRTFVATDRSPYALIRNRIARTDDHLLIQLKACGGGINNMSVLMALMRQLGKRERATL